MEIWKPVSGYNGLYEVSNRGRIMSCTRVNTCGGVVGSRVIGGKVLAPLLKNNGYIACALSKNGKTKHFSVHRLVAIAFVAGRTKERNIVNHIDGDKANNNDFNLEWCTPSENTIHAYRDGGSFSKKYDGIPFEKIAETLYSYARTDLSLNKIAQLVGIEYEQVRAIVRSDSIGFGWTTPREAVQNLLILPSRCW